LDRRIERLEREFAKFETDVALMKAEQGHLRELVTAKFTETALSLARIEGTVASAQTLIQTASTDPSASPLGRALTQDILAVAVTAGEAKTIAERVDRRVLLATGAIGVIAWIAGIVGPVLARTVFGQ
jgi:hypothetical protein